MKDQIRAHPIAFGIRALCLPASRRFAATVICQRSARSDTSNSTAATRPHLRADTGRPFCHGIATRTCLAEAFAFTSTSPAAAPHPFQSQVSLNSVVPYPCSSGDRLVAPATRLERAHDKGAVGGKRPSQLGGAGCAAPPFLLEFLAEQLVHYLIGSYGPVSMRIDYSPASMLYLFGIRMSYHGGGGLDEHRHRPGGEIIPERSAN